jgi:hypothetical protein
LGKSIVGGVTIINTLTQKNDGEFPIAMARDIFMNNNTTVEDRINALNNYTHPVTPGYRHVPSGGEMGQYLKWKDDGEAQWVTIPNASNNVDGFLSHLDKAKLDNIAENANNYVHPITPGNKHIPAGGESGNILKWKDDGEAQWETEKTYQNASTTSAGLMSAEDKQKLDSVSGGAEKYTHPTTPGNKHIPAGGSTNQILRWKSDGEAQWDNEKSYNDATITNSGLMSSTDKTKLDGIASGANNYTHPVGDGYNHIPEGGKDGQYLKYESVGKAQWADLDIPKYNVVSKTENGLMTKEDKAKLDNIAENANNYVHPTTSGNKHIPSGGSEGQVLRYVSDGTAMWANDKDTVYTHPLYTKESLGLYKLSVDETGHVNSVSPVVKADITALGISGGEGPTYTVGTETTAGISKLYSSTGSNTDGSLTQKALTDELAKKSSSNHTHTNASSTNDGFMSKEDKAKIDSIASGANNYAHPSYTSYVNGLYKVSVDDKGHVSAATAVTKGDITALGIPGQDTNTTYDDASQTAHGLMTAEDKKKLDGIANGANAYTHPSATAYASGLYKITTNNLGHVTAATAVTKSDITALGIPSNSDATSTSSGLMSSTDKTKLDGIASGANNYTHPSYTSHVNGLYKITVDDKGHISNASSVTKSDITALGIPSNSDATSTSSGLMSADDKKKLDNIANGANAYSHPTYTNRSKGLYKFSVDELGHVNSVTDVSKDDITALGIPAKDTTYPISSTTNDGLMSADDKKKLDGIPIGGGNYTHPSYTKENLGLYKISVDELGHVNSVSPVVKADITALGISGGQGATYSTGTETTPGVTKLYGSTGTNTDGAITQKAVTDLLGNKADSTHTHELASSENAGFMSASSSAKLAELASFAITDIEHGKSNVIVRAKYDKMNAGPVSNYEYIKIDSATETSSGVMSADDKKKLNTISEGATSYSTGTETSSGITKLYTSSGSSTDGTMTQKSITDALNGKTDLNHTHPDAADDHAGFMSQRHVQILTKLNAFNIKRTEYSTDSASVIASSVDIDKNYEPFESTYITINGATSSTAGLMSAEDKAKLDKITLPTSMQIGFGATAPSDLNIGDLWIQTEE